MTIPWNLQWPDQIQHGECVQTVSVTKFLASSWLKNKPWISLLYKLTTSITLGFIFMNFLDSLLPKLSWKFSLEGRTRPDFFTLLCMPVKMFWTSPWKFLRWQLTAIFKANNKHTNDVINVFLVSLLLTFT